VGAVAARATPDGEYTERDRMLTDRCRIETIGFWRGSFGLVRLEWARSAVQAVENAKADFDAWNVRFLLHSGRVSAVNRGVEVTGRWPTRWKVTKLNDVFPFCAFLFERSVARGAGDAATSFRDTIHYASPPTEQILVLVRALETAKATLWPFLDQGTKSALDTVLATTRGWLRR
jgi:hypothetical protein